MQDGVHLFCHLKLGLATSLPSISAARHGAKSPRREVVRSSAGTGVIYPPFFGVIRVAYPKA